MKNEYPIAFIELDSKKRKIFVFSRGNSPRRFYYGSDAKGFLEEDDLGEFIIVGEEKRYWRGIINFLPNYEMVKRLNDFHFFILKPDVVERGLKSTILKILEENDFNILHSRTIIFDRSLVFRMYPYFFTTDWEKNLVEYFSSGFSECMLIQGRGVSDDLFGLRNAIRKKFRDSTRHPVVNLVHCSDSKADALREAFLIFKREEIIKGVGFKK